MRKSRSSTDSKVGHSVSASMPSILGKDTVLNRIVPGEFIRVLKLGRKHLNVEKHACMEVCQWLNETCCQEELKRTRPLSCTYSIYNIFKMP